MRAAFPSESGGLEPILNVRLPAVVLSLQNDFSRRLDHPEIRCFRASKPP